LSNSDVKLTTAQKKIADEYKNRYYQIAINTDPCDRAKAEDALTKAYRLIQKRKEYGETELVSVSDKPEFLWVDSPFAGAIEAAKTARPNLTVGTSEFEEEVKNQASQASFGSFESYWISFYDFINTEIKKENSDVVEIVREIAKNCGVYWTFDKKIIISEKPVKISLKNDKLHDDEDLALKFKDGSGIYCVDGVRKRSLVETTIDSLYGKIESNLTHSANGSYDE